MRIQDQVSTRTQAIKLKGLGIVQNSLYYYHPIFREPVGGSENNYFNNKEEYSSAFTVAELGIMLPDVYADNQWYTIPNAGYNKEGVNLEPPHCFSLHIGETTDKMDSEPFDGYCYSTEAEARAEYLIYLLDNKFITPEEINNRLNS